MVPEKGSRATEATEATEATDVSDAVDEPREAVDKVTVQAAEPCLQTAPAPAPRSSPRDY